MAAGLCLLVVQYCQPYEPSSDLQTDRLTFTVVGVKSCTDLLNTLNTYVESGEFASDANEESIPVQVATLLNALCAGRNAGVASVTNLAPPSMQLP